MADPFDDNSVVALVRQAFYNDDDSAQQIWSDFKIAFARLPPPGRRCDIHHLDTQIGENAAPTRETAHMMTMRRELVDLDRLLRDAGR
jgi:hypothetical protein